MDEFMDRESQQRVSKQPSRPARPAEPISIQLKLRNIRLCEAILIGGPIAFITSLLCPIPWYYGRIGACWFVAAGICLCWSAAWPPLAKFASPPLARIGVLLLIMFSVWYIGPIMFGLRYGHFPIDGEFAKHHITLHMTKAEISAMLGEAQEKHRHHRGGHETWLYHTDCLGIGDCLKIGFDAQDHVERVSIEPREQPSAEL